MRPGVDIEYSSSTQVVLKYRDCLIKRTWYVLPGFQWYVLEGGYPEGYVLQNVPSPLEPGDETPRVVWPLSDKRTQSRFTRLSAVAFGSTSFV